MSIGCKRTSTLNLASARCSSGKPLAVTGSEMQVFALFGERLGDARTDSLRCAGHQRPLVFEA
jgi:hypothetical protein